MQTFPKDSTITYNQEELRAIASKLVAGSECDTLLKICDKLGQYKDSVITAQDTIIAKQEVQLGLATGVINTQDSDIQKLKSDLAYTKGKIKWIKIGWVATSAILFSTLIYVIAHQ